VQQAATESGAVTSLSVTFGAVTSRSDLLIVELGVWGRPSARASALTDNAGDAFTQLVAFVASDDTQLSVWSAVVVNGGTKPIITSTTTGRADIGLVALEYNGTSTAPGAAAVDQQATSSGTTAGGQLLRSAPTGALTANNELVIGFYVDSGFNTTPIADPPFIGRTELAGSSIMDMLVEDHLENSGTTPAAGVTVDASATWLLVTIAFRSAN
jgi:hypothetical protein